ncbi:MAG: MBL fold metallo-hydrolase [Longimicrobiales bacterium]
MTFLGTGTSFGVPVVGCDCETCESADPRDRRLRHAALIETLAGRRRLLIDTPPELRLQLLGAGVDQVEAVWFTHEHADHTAGIDDLRIFSARAARPLRAFAGEACADNLRQRFRYIFDERYRPPAGTTKPEIRLETVQPFEPVEILGLPFQPLPVPHGDVDAYGFRAGGLGYLTDAQEVPGRVRDSLRGVSVLVLSALWWGRPHPTHLTVEEALAVAEDIAPERCYLVHLTHRVRHAALLERLPDGIEPAYDGLTVGVPDRGLD